MRKIKWKKIGKDIEELYNIINEMNLKIDIKL